MVATDDLLGTFPLVPLTFSLVTLMLAGGKTYTWMYLVFAIKGVS